MLHIRRLVGECLRHDYLVPLIHGDLPVVPLHESVTALLLHSLVTHRLVLRRVRLHLRPIERNGTKLHQTGLAAQLQHLHKQLSQHIKVHSPKLAHRGMVRVQPSGDHAEGHVLVGLPLDLP